MSVVFGGLSQNQKKDDNEQSDARTNNLDLYAHPQTPPLDDEDSKYASHKKLQHGSIRSKSSSPRSSPKWFISRLLFPYDSASKVLTDQEMRDAIVNFSQQAGVVFTLLASISATGLFLEALVPGAAAGMTGAPIDQAVVVVAGASVDAPSTIPALLDYYTCSYQAKTHLGIHMKPLLFQLAAPSFCASTFCSLYGLINATNVLGRAQIVPTSYIKDYVQQNSGVVHSTYWILIPAIGSFGLGVVCTVNHFYGEPLTTMAVLGYGLIGVSQARNLYSLGAYTERVTERAERGELVYAETK